MRRGRAAKHLRVTTYFQSSTRVAGLAGCRLVEQLKLKRGYMYLRGRRSKSQTMACALSTANLIRPECSIEIGVNWIKRGGCAENGFMLWKYGMHSRRETEKEVWEEDANILKAYSPYAGVVRWRQIAIQTELAWSFQVILLQIHWFFCSNVCLSRVCRAIQSNTAQHPFAKWVQITIPSFLSGIEQYQIAVYKNMKIRKTRNNESMKYRAQIKSKEWWYSGLT